MLQIYVDARCLQDENYRNRGVGRHTVGVLKHAKEFLPQSSEIVGVIDDFNLPSLNSEYINLFDRLINSFGEAANKADIFLNPFIFSHGQIKTLNITSNNSIYSACLFYDLIPLFNKSKYLSFKTDELQYLADLNNIYLYDSIFSISLASQNDLKSVVNISDLNCYVTGVGISDIFYSKKQNYLNTNQKRFNHANYFIMVGGADDRKNMDFALKAFEIVNKTSKTKLSFVLVGSYSAVQLKRFEEISKKGKFSDKLFIYNSITDLELKELYSGAIANICPSLCEGFFVPLVEGITCDCPPLASNIPAQRELLGNDVEVLFDLDHIYELTSLMKNISENKTWRNKILTRHHHLANDFIEKKVSQRVWKSIYQDYIKSKTKKITKSRVVIVNKKPRIALITPYPSDMSGCATYSYATTKILSQKVVLDVYTDAEPLKKDSNVNNYAKISAKPYLSDNYDAIISVVGNSHYHSKIYDLVLNYGGHVIEHDNRLLDFITWKFGSEYAAKMASSELNEEINTDEIQYWLHHSEKIRALMLNNLYDSSQKFFLHSKQLINHFLLTTGRKASYLPFCQYNNFNLTNKNSRYKEIRKQLGIQNNEIVVVSLGSVHPSKYCDEIVKSAIYAHSKNNKVKYYFIGYCSNAQYIQLQSYFKSDFNNICIKPEYYFSEKEYEDYLFAADIGIQLRKHKFGGLSGGLMDCISTGLTTISNNDLAQAMDAPSYVKRTSDTPTPKEIGDLLIDLINTETYKRINDEERSQYIQVHNFSAYCDQLIKQLNLQ